MNRRKINVTRGTLLPFTEWRKTNQIKQLKITNFALTALMFLKLQGCILHGFSTYVDIIMR